MVFDRSAFTAFMGIMVVERALFATPPQLRQNARSKANKQHDRKGSSNQASQRKRQAAEKNAAFVGA